MVQGGRSSSEIPSGGRVTDQLLSQGPASRVVRETGQPVTARTETNQPAREGGKRRWYHEPPLVLHRRGGIYFPTPGGTPINLNMNSTDLLVPFDLNK